MEEGFQEEGKTYQAFFAILHFPEPGNAIADLFCDLEYGTFIFARFLKDFSPPQKGRQKFSPPFFRKQSFHKVFKGF